MRDSDGALPAGLQVARSWAVLQRAGALPWTPPVRTPQAARTQPPAVLSCTPKVNVNGRCRR